MFTTVNTRKTRAFFLFLMFSGLLGFGSLACQATIADARHHYNVYIEVALLPQSSEAHITWTIADAEWLKVLDFNLAKVKLLNIQANGEWQETQQRLRWQLPKKNASLSYRVKLKHKRNAEKYDAWIEKNWALFRAEDILPPVRVRKVKGSVSTSYLSFKLPSAWSDVNMAWLPKDGQFWKAPSGQLEVPKGWIIAGQLGTRHEVLDGIRLTVSAPKGHDFRQMETLAFVTSVWPHFKKVFKPKGQKALIIGAGEPMWRGGLSGPESLFVHADRPLISENGTSTLVHELVHSLSDLKGAKGHDWITEGLAEYYSVEILFRAGFFTTSRRNSILDGLRRWAGASRETDSGEQKQPFVLAAMSSKAENTARAVYAFQLLDQELKRANQSLDLLLDRVEDNKAMTLVMLQQTYKRLTGQVSQVLQRVSVDTEQ